MAFSVDEKVRVRHHLGYQNVGQVATFAMGMPAAFQTAFQIESAMNKILPEAEAKARELIARLDLIEGQMSSDLELLAIEKIDVITVRKDEMDALRREYQYHRSGLGNVFGVPPNPFDFRFGMTSGGVNVPVNH